jgi:hypothetical protein
VNKQQITNLDFSYVSAYAHPQAECNCDNIECFEPFTGSRSEEHARVFR